MIWRVTYKNPNEPVWDKRGRRRVKTYGATHTIDVEAKTEAEAKIMARLNLSEINSRMKPGIMFAERISDVA